VGSTEDKCNFILLPEFVNVHANYCKNQIYNYLYIAISNINYNKQNELTRAQGYIVDYQYDKSN
jgi:hypothetical protein